MSLFNNRSNKNSRRRNPDVTRIRLPMTRHVGFSARFITTVASELNVFIPTGSATYQYGNYFSVATNNIYTPFSNSPYTPTTGSGTYLYGFSASTVQGNTVSDQPLWYSELGQIYQSYKVLRYKLKVCCRSTSTTDVFEIVLFPLANEFIPSSSQSNVNTRVLSAQPFAKHKTCAYSGSARYDCVALSQPVHLALNIRESAWLDFPATPMTQAPGTDGGQGISSYAGFFLQMLAGVANTGPITISIELLQEVEFTDINSPVI